MSQTATQTIDRIKLPLSYDTAKIMEEIGQLGFKEFEYYNAVQLRGPAHMIDTSLPPPPPAEDYADGTWTDWLNIPELEQTPYLKSIIEQFQEHTFVTLVRLLRLAPGAVLKEHTDPTLGLEVHKSVIRLTIPVLNNDKVVFYLNGTPVHMKPGECWYMRLTDPHQVVNGGTEERINISIDMIPNDWVRKLIEDAEKHQ